LGKNAWVQFEAAPTRIRDAYAESASWFSSVVNDVAPADWLRPGLGSWTVRELVGHTSRNCTYVLDLVIRDQSTDRRLGPFAFWDGVLAGSNVELHAGIAAAALAASEALGDDPRSAIRDLVDQTLALVASLPDGAVVRFGSAGELALIDYLPSRIVEFVCHGIDVCEAIGRTSDVPTEALAITTELLVAFADPIAVVKLLVGRNGSSYNVFQR
jgi:uncharacterized protein (TIGR03083 family)